MIRSVILASTFFTLASCQMVDQPQTTTREDRIAAGLTVISDCGQTECGRLNLDSRLVEDYAIIAPLTHVTAFMTSYSDFSSLDDIATMSQLRELHIGQTQISDLSGLSNFPNLTLLHAQNLSNVTDFSPIGQLNGLTELAIGGNKVGDMAFLRGMSRLSALNLQYAEVSSLDVLRRLPALERLDLISADLPDDISALLRIPNLKVVAVTDWDMSEAQEAVLDQLRAKGVSVEYEIAVIVC